MFQKVIQLDSVKTMRRRSSLTLVAATALAFGVSAGVAEATTVTAVNWGPIYAYYGDVMRTAGKGTFSNQNYSTALNHMYLNDVSNDGNNSYENVTFMFYGPNGSCGADGSGHNLTCWWTKSRQTTGEYTYANTPVWVDRSTGLDSAATQARGSTSVCVQLGWPVPDHCATAIPTFSY